MSFLVLQKIIPGITYAIIMSLHGPNDLLTANMVRKNKQQQQ